MNSSTGGPGARPTPSWNTWRTPPPPTSCKAPSTWKSGVAPASAKPSSGPWDPGDTAGRSSPSRRSRICWPESPPSREETSPGPRSASDTPWESADGIATPCSGWARPWRPRENPPRPWRPWRPAGPCSEPTPSCTAFWETQSWHEPWSRPNPKRSPSGWRGPRPPIAEPWSCGPRTRAPWRPWGGFCGWRTGSTKPSSPGPGPRPCAPIRAWPSGWAGSCWRPAASSRPGPPSWARTASLAPPPPRRVLKNASGGPVAGSGRPCAWPSRVIRRVPGPSRPKRWPSWAPPTPSGCC